MSTNGSFQHALLLTGALLGTSPALAAEPVETRIASLEKQVAELKAQLKPQTPTTAATPQPTSSAPSSNPVTGACLNNSGTRREVYGFVRLDGSYDTGRITPGNIALYAPSEGIVNNDSEFNLTANATRLGVNLCGPNTDSMMVGGTIEFDFLSNLGAENNASPRLRHAYLKMFWPSSDLLITAGQTWDLNGSLIPFVDDPAIMWDAGNIGGRHPQLRLTKGFKSGEKSRLELAVAAARTIGEANGTYPDPGKDAAIPTIQARLALNTPLFVSGKPATVSISGHYGQEEWDTAADGTHRTFDSWSYVLEFSLPVCNHLLLAGELFSGENLDDYWGGIGQGINRNDPNNMKAIRSHGGWAALRYTASAETTFNLGAGLDNPDDRDLWSGARSINEMQFISVSHTLASHLILGGQLSHIRTGYINQQEGDAVRIQSSLTFTF
jgi:hypothetical protein